MTDIGDDLAATNLVLALTEMLRRAKAVVEFFGAGLASLSPEAVISFRKDALKKRD